MTELDREELDDPQRWECGNCGHAFYDDDGWLEWYCSQCGEEMSPIAPEGYTPNDELRELIEEWCGRAKWREEGYLMAASELEAVLDDE